jgi:ATP-dependent Clp protease ATP-binding subunit ClpC
MSLPTTPKLDKVIAQATREALDRGDTFVGTEHLLLALLRVGSGRAHELLNDCRVTIEKLERKLSE